MVTRRKRLYIDCSGLPGQRPLHVNRVILGIWSLNGHLLVTLGKRLCMLTVQVTQGTAFIMSVELFLRDGFEMAGHSIVIVRRYSA